MRNTVRISLLVWMFGLVGAFFSLSTARAQDACSAFSSLTATAQVTGATNGIPSVDFAAGSVITVTTTLGTATSGTFSIVGGPSGSPVLAGPASIPGTLSYTVPAALPAGSLGIGWYVNSANGGNVNIAQLSCVPPLSTQQTPQPAPAMSRLGSLAAAMLMLLLGIAMIRRAKPSGARSP